MSDYGTLGRVLFRYADGTEFRAFVSAYDQHGTRIDGNPDTRCMAMRTGRTIPIGGWNAARNADTTLSALPLRGTLRRILAMQDANRTKAMRRESVKRFRARSVEWKREWREQSMAEWTQVSPLVSLAYDVEAGRVPQSHEIVTESGRIDPYGNRHYITFVNEAMGYLVQLERLHSDYRSQIRITESVMRHANSGGYATRANRPWKATRNTTSMYLTQSDLQNATDNARDGKVEVMTENARGIQCVRYFRNRGWRVEAIVKRHTRDASSAS